MSERVNELQQPIGEEVVGWQSLEMPARTPLQGRYCRVEPLDILTHVDELYEAFAADREGRLWTYMPMGPFASAGELKDWMDGACTGEDPLFYVIIEADSDKAVGFASHMRIKPDIGVMEVGYIAYSPQLQGTRTATEAMYLLMCRAFDELGYRRYEWKCDALNAASRSAALRLGFTYEGTFKQATIYKGRNRDTAWFSMLDRDWPSKRKAFECWLAEGNHDEQGRQKHPLQHFADLA
ncbi:GNAT family N-acetyltransferase [Granulosicoccus sp. 3-233]|uniref:GNAT family N-acetyltransferase n=1 Tax=Granulosicoccus sp. 3-233 TaxID=3417969 RepID=UPI003D32EB48